MGGVEFVNTGIWNYVRYVMLANVVLEKEALPTEWKDQAAIFYSWFESVGFNRYNNRLSPEFIEEPTGSPVTVSRTMEVSLPTDVPAHREPPKSAEEILPAQKRKKVGAIDVSFRGPHLPIGLVVKTCDSADASSYALCGLAVQDGHKCTCWDYVAPFNLRTTLYLDKLMALAKLPARAFMYGQMKYWSVPIEKTQVQIYCEQTESNCSFEVHFPENSRVLQWSWFGKQPKMPFTAEGMAIFSLIVLVLCALYLMSTRRVKDRVGAKKLPVRRLTLDKGIAAS